MNEIKSRSKGCSPLHLVSVKIRHKTLLINFKDYIFSGFLLLCIAFMPK